MRAIPIGVFSPGTPKFLTVAFTPAAWRSDLQARRIAGFGPRRIVPDPGGDAVAEGDIGLPGRLRGEGQPHHGAQEDGGGGREAVQSHGILSREAEACRFSAGQRIRTVLPSKLTTGRSSGEATVARAFTRPAASRSSTVQPWGTALT